MINLQDIKEYLKIDTVDSDGLLSSYLTSSVSFVVNATHTNVNKDDALFDTAQRLLIAYWHENPTVVGKVVPNPFLDMIFMQLKLTSSDVVS